MKNIRIWDKSISEQTNLNIRIFESYHEATQPRLVKAASKLGGTYSILNDDFVLMANVNRYLAKKVRHYDRTDPEIMKQITQNKDIIRQENKESMDLFFFRPSTNPRELI